MTQTTDKTRALILRFLDARARNDLPSIRAMLAEDAQWQPPRTIRVRPIRGRDRVAAGLTGGRTSHVLDVGSIEREIIGMTVEQDVAVVRQVMRAVRLDGQPYVNDYCWIYTCRDGLVTDLVEYGDTLLTARAGFVPLDA